MTKTMSRRGFLTGVRLTPTPRSQVAGEAPAPPARSFLEGFYAARRNDPCPPLVYEEGCLVWNAHHDTHPKPEDG